MSAGQFVSSRYTTNDGGVCPCRVQPETLALVIDGVTNAATTDAIDQEASALMSGGKRQFGVIARTVTIEWTAAPPEGYDPNQLLTVPCLQQAIYNGAKKDTTGTYLGVGVKVKGRSPERVN